MISALGGTGPRTSAKAAEHNAPKEVVKLLLEAAAIGLRQRVRRVCLPLVQFSNRPISNWPTLLERLVALKFASLACPCI